MQRVSAIDSAAKPSWLDLWKNNSRLEGLHRISIVLGYFFDPPKDCIFQKCGGSGLRNLHLKRQLRIFSLAIFS